MGGHLFQVPYSALCRINKGGTNQSLTAGSYQKVTWSAAATDDDSLFDSGNSRIVVKVAGIYLIAAQVVFTGGIAAAELLFSRIYINGASGARIAVTAPGTSDVAVVQSGIRRLAAGDTIEIYAYKNTGSATAIYGNTNDTALEVAYLGA